ncbi:hypothetical protein HC341_07120 [Aquisalimonas sp. 2447]|uniref:hypothetical protein n=1 Tax=Aquisalimonas sp. 2447 TaxID=2740807 RepID=UPI0014324DC2|nr:hypothetical protein [Aquisalimonas sp. 2447]QIT55005.1 hypothetical protein HC341_07120 [Aquisalimonas sp. 2447]
MYENETRIIKPFREIFACPEKALIILDEHNPSPQDLERILAKLWEFRVDMPKDSEPVRAACDVVRATLDRRLNEQHISAMERLSASSDSLGKANLWLGGGLAALAGVQIIVMIW